MKKFQDFLLEDSKYSFSSDKMFSSITSEQVQHLMKLQDNYLPYSQILDSNYEQKMKAIENLLRNSTIGFHEAKPKIDRLDEVLSGLNITIVPISKNPKIQFTTKQICPYDPGTSILEFSKIYFVENLPNTSSKLMANCISIGSLSNNSLQDINLTCQNFKNKKVNCTFRSSLFDFSPFYSVDISKSNDKIRNAESILLANNFKAKPLINLFRILSAPNFKDTLINLPSDTILLSYQHLKEFSKYYLRHNSEIWSSESIDSDTIQALVKSGDIENLKILNNYIYNLDSSTLLFDIIYGLINLKLDITTKNIKISSSFEKKLKDIIISKEPKWKFIPIEDLKYNDIFKLIFNLRDWLHNNDLYSNSYDQLLTNIILERFKNLTPFS